MMKATDLYHIALAGTLAVVVSQPGHAELVGHWSFDREEDGKSADISGHDYDAELKGGAVLVKDQERGKVLRLRGLASGDTVVMPKLAKGHALAAEAGATIAAWIKRDDYDTAGTAGDAYDYIFYLRGKKAEQLSLSINANNAKQDLPSSLHMIIEGDKPGNNKDGDQVVRSGPANIVDGVWTHVAVTFDRVNNKAYLYKDGIPMGPVDISSVGDGKLAWSDVGIGEFGGYIDDLRYYDEPLSHNQVAELAKK